MEFTPKQIAQCTNGHVYGHNSLTICHFIVDSRQPTILPGSMFVALHGPTRDGHSFIGEMAARGLSMFLVTYIPDQYASRQDLVFIVVDNTLRAMQQIAATHRNKFSIPIIGITGSNGKTTVKEWLAQSLATRYTLICSPKSYNSQTGVPLSVSLMEAKHQLAVFEAGISQPGEMQFLEPILRPTIGIFTNIGQAHQQHFANLDDKVREKLLLFRHSDVLIYCKDHELIHRTVIQNPDFRHTRLITWTRDPETAATLVITDIRQLQSQTTLRGIYLGQEVKTSLPFSDEASVENGIHVWIVLLHLGYEQSETENLMQNLARLELRLEVKEAVNNSTLVVDCYNADPASLKIALDYLCQQRKNQSKTLILSDFQQISPDTDSLYAQIARLVEQYPVKKLIGIGPELNQHRDLFHVPGYFFDSADAFLAQINLSDFRNEAILIKGARQFKLERIASSLQKKMHRTVLEINLNALQHNLSYYRSLLRPQTKIMCMVKALAYGSGSQEIASFLEHQRVNYLGVAIADEGIELRQAGISIPIMVMNPEPESFERLIEYNLEPELFGFTTLRLFSEAVRKSGQQNYPVHIKLDTGMHRLGFCPNEIPALTAALLQQPRLQVKSIFSHLAGTDETELDAFTNEQIALFEQLTKNIAKEIVYPFDRHILNSSGIERFPQAQFEMVRLGIGLYGESATAGSMLMTVSTLKTTILQVKTVNSGETVGYSRKGHVGRTSRIAILPIGYADGLSRKLSNGRGKALVNGKPAPYIGNICMDMSMLDITGIQAGEGDEVIIFGKELTATQLARMAETIPYEILTDVSARVKKVYYYE